MKPAIQVENLSKRFQLGTRQFGSYRTLRESLADAARAPWNRLRSLARRSRSAPAAQPNRAALWALEDVSFEVQHGEVVGLIGRNGAGKSTLLKVLSRITEPTHGLVRLRGQVGSLLEVGTGFHPELTGRENIYLNGSILGMSRQEISRKFDEIVAFAEMDRFLDTPVKRYSSGMYVRLAFAVAAHLDLEILLVDEVLAVGDIEFQKKCLARMSTIAQGGRTVVFVSHNLGLIHRLCSRTILLRKGKLQAQGPTAGIIQEYLRESQQYQGHWKRSEPKPEGKEVYLQAASVLGSDCAVTGIVQSDEEFAIAVDYEVTTPTPNFEIAIGLRNGEGVNVVVSLDSDTCCWPNRIRPAGFYRSTCRIPRHLLAPGSYFLTFSAHIINQQTYEIQFDAMSFEVAETGCIRTKRNDRRNAVIMPIFDWEICQLG